MKCILGTSKMPEPERLTPPLPQPATALDSSLCLIFKIYLLKCTLAILRHPLFSCSSGYFPGNLAPGFHIHLMLAHSSCVSIHISRPNRNALTIPCLV
jgi:hypothetical protein